MPSPPSQEFVRVLDFSPPAGVSLDAIDDLSPELGEYLTHYVETCVDVTSYQVAEIGRRDGTWSDLLRSERMRAENLNRYIDDTDPILPWFAWALLGAGTGIGLGIYLGVLVPQ